MPDQVIPITGLADVGVIKDTPAVSLPPNAFTNAQNVRFRDGAVRKMEGEVDIFEGMSAFFDQNLPGTTTDEKLIGALVYLAWWPNPNITTLDQGYYIFVTEKNIANAGDPVNLVHAVYAMKPGATFTDTTTWHEIGPANGFSRSGKWQHTLFNGGFTFIINNGVERPQYITDAQGNTDITMIALNDLPGWDSYNVDETIINDTYNQATHGNTPEFETGISIQGSPTEYVVLRNGTSLNEVTDYNVNTGAAGESNDTIRFLSGILNDGDTVVVRYQSTNNVTVRAAIVRAFGDFLVAGNLVEVDSVDNSQIIRRMTGVVRTSNVAQPGSIPNDWNPFAVGASTADEFVIADTGTVQDMVPLQGNMYLYTNTSISVLRLTGNPTVPLTVQPVTDQYGALTTDAVLEYDGRHFVIGSDDIYLFGGHPGSIQSIADKKIRRDFFTRVNPINDNLINLFTLRYAGRDEIWVCYPTVNSVSGEADEAYIWNYRNNTWTTRTLNSVVAGDVAPIPGGGIPSAIITLSGMSGTDDVITVGSREVQTIDVAGTATVGHATAARPERYSFRSLEATPAPANTARPALDLDAPELVEVTIGNDFYSGPNPALQEYNILNVPNITAGAFASGGARFTIQYTLASANTGNDNTMITVHANELTLPGTGNRMVSGADYASALASHLDGLTEFDTWTITSNGTTINLRSDYAGMRELRALEITTFTAQAESLIDTTTYMGMSDVFTDSFGDELFTVNRSGTTAPYTFSVVTSRNTGFADSDGITQLAFITDGTTFAAPDPFNRTSDVFTFESTSGEYTLRQQPPPNFVNLVRETDRIPDSGNIDDTAVNEDGVLIERNEVVGGYTRESTDSSTPLDDNNEGVRVQVTNTTTQGTLLWRLFNSSDLGGSSDLTANATRNQGLSMSMSANQNRLIRFAADGDRSNDTDSAFAFAYDGQRFSYGFVSGGFYYRYLAQRSSITGNSANNFANEGFSITDEALMTWTHSAGTGAITLFNANVVGRNSGQATAATARAGGSLNGQQQTAIQNLQVASASNHAIGGPGIVYANNVVVMIETHSDGDGMFSGRSQFGQHYVTTNTAGDIQVNVARGTTAVSSREFTVTNSAPFGITFNYQGGSSNNVVLPGNNIMIAGASGSTDESWVWVNRPISLTGTSIGGSGTQDLRADRTNPTRGQRTVTGNGVTVTSQNTSTPQTTSMTTGRDRAVLAPASNGNSITNADTITWNPSSRLTTVNWNGSNNANLLSAYRLSNGTRVTGGIHTDRNSNNPPSGWGTTSFESYSFNPLTISATNITTPVAMTTATESVQRGVLNCGSQGCECTNLQSATATGTFQSGTAIMQSGTNFSPDANVIGVGIQGSNGRNGFQWTIPSTGRSNECGGDLSGGSSFNGTIRVYATTNYVAPTGVRIIVSGPNVTTTVTVPRASSETYLVTNDNPFPITFTAGGESIAVAADSSGTLNLSSEGNTWTVSTPTTTNYQYSITNNNVRPLISGTLTHDMSMIDLAGLAPGESRRTGFSTVRTANATFVREVEQSGAMTVITPADLMLVRSGVGTTPTAPADLEAVRYNFSVNFTDSTPDINIDYQTPENRTPGALTNQTNVEATEGFVRALAANAEFNRYFQLHVAAALVGVNAIVDPEVDAGSFRIEARDAPGMGIMPPHDALDISTEVDQMNGGDADLTVTSIQQGTNTTNDAITLNISQGTQVPQPDGTDMNVRANTHAIVFNGMYSADAAGSARLNEVVRDHLRLDSMFNDLWNVDTTAVNPASVMFTSDNNGPHYIQTDSVTPASSGVLPQHFSFASTQRGLVTPTMPIYPSITLESPAGDDTLPQTISLAPIASRTSTTRLNNVDIANSIKARFSAPGWTIVSGIDPNIGDAPAAGQIRLVRDTEGVLDSGATQMSGWRVTNISYGNIGSTLPSTIPLDPSDTESGRLGLDDFDRVSGQGLQALDPANINMIVGMGDNLDFRGSRTERSQPTRVMVSITNPDIVSQDPVRNPDGTFARNDDGTIATIEGNTQYIPLIYGSRGTYDPRDQSGSQPGTRISATDIINSIESNINNTNRRLQTDRQGNVLTIIPSQFSEIANFVLDIFINDTTTNAERWNAILANNQDQERVQVAAPIILEDNMGIQSTVEPNVDSGSDEQFRPGNRIPNFADRSIDTGPLISNTSEINTEFDPLRPWPTTQVNLNREYPIFATNIVNSGTGELTRHFRGADIGFLFLTDPYESFVERIELALTPEFDTEQLQSIALWATGGSAAEFGGELQQAMLDIMMYGSNSPGQTQGMYDAMRAGNAKEIMNEFIIGDDYKIDMRIHGRFINLRITDLDTTNRVAWAISGIQADVKKGGTR